MDSSVKISNVTSGLTTTINLVIKGDRELKNGLSHRVVECNMYTSNKTLQLPLWLSVVYLTFWSLHPSYICDRWY